MPGAAENISAVTASILIIESGNAMNTTKDCLTMPATNPTIIDAVLNTLPSDPLILSFMN